MTDYFQANFPSRSVAATKSEVDRQQFEHGETSEKLAISIVNAASERKAGDILLLKVADVSYLSDYFIIATGYSNVQVRAIADAVEKTLETEWQRSPLRTEGKAEGNWVLQDYGDVIVHVMMPYEREFYNLEAFWGHAESVELELSDDDGMDRYD